MNILTDKLKKLSLWFVRRMHPGCAVSLSSSDPVGCGGGSTIIYRAPLNATSVEVISRGGGGGGGASVGGRFSPGEPGGADGKGGKGGYVGPISKESGDD